MRQTTDTEVPLVPEADISLSDAQENQHLPACARTPAVVPREPRRQRSRGSCKSGPPYPHSPCCEGQSESEEPLEMRNTSREPNTTRGLSLSGGLCLPGAWDVHLQILIHADLLVLFLFFSLCVCLDFWSNCSFFVPGMFLGFQVRCECSMSDLLTVGLIPS